MKKYKTLMLIILCSMSMMAQDTIQEPSMTSEVTKLEEIILIGRRKLSSYRQEKTLSSIDDFLEKSNRVTMIKRGSYAWEPALNNMQSDRLSVTIDGMHIFGACTDKMDPITSYVDVSNLERVSIGSGQEGSENGHSIGGGINMVLKRNPFSNSGFKSSFDLGYETNGNYKSTGLDLGYTGEQFYINVDGIFRKSDNYDAGKNIEILYSQFQKYNFAVQTGFKFSEAHRLDANVIFDKANNVGYPALTMDVSLAEAWIMSLNHTYFQNTGSLETLETKLYANSITHIMDDTTRPIVPIRMDMPGWSDTYGFYTKASLRATKHALSFNVNGFYNRSLAEMTMYPNDPSQPDMFMYTWPDIRTLYTGFYMKDSYRLNEFETITASARLGFHQNEIAKEAGLLSLQIFYPQIEASKNRLLTSFSSDYQYKKENYDFNFGLGYGERAPSVSEGYGFFLFNSFDNYDYIGNPTLKNESSLEGNFKANYHKNGFHIGLETSIFYINNYVIGQIDSSISTMTIGATGVKRYEALSNAQIFGAYVNSSYNISNAFSINGMLGYNYGSGDSEKLPFIKPLSYLAEFNYKTNAFNAAVQFEGNGNQTRYSSFYGEDETPFYNVVNLNFGNSIYLNSSKLIVKYGIENLLDRNYSTYADWNNILRKGRNFYINTSFVF